MGFFYGSIIKELHATQLAKALPAIPVKEGNHHITLLYVGDRPSDQADNKVEQAVSNIPCFTIHTKQVILLPTPSKPRMTPSPPCKGEVSIVEVSIVAPLWG